MEHPEWAGQFLTSAGLFAVVSTDFEKLKKAFDYKTYPFAVAIENGRQKATNSMPWRVEAPVGSTALESPTNFSSEPIE